ncbi:MAG: ABC-2 transporter permease, partial [Ruthenibacterium sp.]
MIGLIWKDFYMLRRYFIRQMGLMFLLYFIICLPMKSFTIMPAMLTVMTGMLLVSSFSMDETSHWDSYALTLPVTPRDVIRAKYVLFLGGQIVIGMCSAVLCCVLDSFIFHQGAAVILSSAAAVCLLYVPINCLSIPLYIKLGAEKARTCTMLIYLIPFFAIMLVAQLLKPYLPSFSPSTLTAAQIGLLLSAGVAISAIICI